MTEPTGIHDFDFLMGRWRVRHRRLARRLAGCTEWIEFPGTTTAQKVLGGLGNMDDNQLDLPVIGNFEDGVGAFFADDTFEGKAIRMRFIWSRITPASCHWEQAFSPDGGVTWESNWTMEFTRDE